MLSRTLSSPEKTAWLYQINIDFDDENSPNRNHFADDFQKYTPKSCADRHIFDGPDSISIRRNPTGKDNDLHVTQGKVVIQSTYNPL